MTALGTDDRQGLEVMISKRVVAVLGVTPFSGNGTPGCSNEPSPCSVILGQSVNFYITLLGSWRYSFHTHVLLRGHCPSSGDFQKQSCFITVSICHQCSSAASWCSGKQMLFHPHALDSRLPLALHGPSEALVELVFGHGSFSPSILIFGFLCHLFLLPDLRLFTPRSSISLLNLTISSLGREAFSDQPHLYAADVVVICSFLSFKRECSPLCC